MKNMLTLESFADWCSKQPADKTYVFPSFSNCACAQYARSIGIEWLQSPVAQFWEEANHIAGIGNSEDWNFGSLSLRLRQSSSRSAK